MTRKEILEYLSDFEVIAEIEKSQSDDFLSKYPQLELGYADFNFQCDGNIYTFRLLMNLPMNTLCFSIKNSMGENLQTFCPLNEYDVDLIFCRELKDHRLYFYENKVYFK